MATFKSSPLGIPNGKIGDVIFYERNGKLICKQAGVPGPQTELQKANCQAMSVTTQLLKPILNFINIGFGQQVKGIDKNPHNLAVSYHKKHALKGFYPNIQVDFTKVIVSQGELSQITDMKFSQTATGLQFNWDPTLKFKAEEYDDQVMILIYYTARKKAEKYLNAAKRSDGAHFIAMDEEDLDSPLAVYISLKSADGTRISDSMYLGMRNQPLERLASSAEMTAMDEKYEEKRKMNALKSRLTQVTKLYIQQLTEIQKRERIEDKAFIALEADYLTLKSSIRHISETLDPEKDGSKLLDN